AVAGRGGIRASRAPTRRRWGCTVATSCRRIATRTGPPGSVRSWPRPAGCSRRRPRWALAAASVPPAALLHPVATQAYAALGDPAAARRLVERAPAAFEGLGAVSAARLARQQLAHL